MESYQQQIKVEVNQMQAQYRTFQSWAQSHISMPDDKQGKQKMFKEWLKNQEDASGEAGLRADGKFYGEKRPKVSGGTEAFQTIGYGHKIPLGQESSFASGITKEQREGLLTEDIKTARTTAKGKYGKGWDDLKTREQIALTEYSFVGHSGKRSKTGKTQLDAKIRGGTSSDTDIATEFAATPDTDRRNKARRDPKTGKGLYSDLVNFDMNTRTTAVKKMLDIHVEFMEEHAVKLLKKHSIPRKYAEKIVKQQIEIAKKFDKKDVSVKDVEEFNRLLARQLGSLGAKD